MVDVAVLKPWWWLRGIVELVSGLTALVLSALVTFVSVLYGVYFSLALAQPESMIAAERAGEGSLEARALAGLVESREFTLELANGFVGGIVICLALLIALRVWAFWDRESGRGLLVPPSVGRRG